MRIYIAAPLGELETARDIAEHLTLAGHDVVSRWHDIAEPGDVDPDDDDTRSAVLTNNLADVASAECVVAWTAAGRPRCTLVEIGFAIALGHRIVWLHSLTGYGRNIADSHPSVTRVSTSPTAINYSAIDAALRSINESIRYMRALQSSRPPAAVGT